MTSDNQKDAILNAVKAASDAWKSAFNTGDAAGCACQYEENAVMRADPFGTFTGIEEIQAFDNVRSVTTNAYGDQIYEILVLSSSMITETVSEYIKKPGVPSIGKSFFARHTGNGV